MTLTIRCLGLELLSVSFITDDDASDDKARDLSGGSPSTERISAGSTDRYMGFTNGREVT